VESIEINSVQALAEFTRTFLRQNPQGGVFGLQGDLGVGKTTFVREVVHALCQTHQQAIPRVISPTYVLHQQYETQPGVDHFDLYRLESLTAEGLMEIGYYEALDRADLGGYLFVEWPERLPTKNQPSKILHFAFTPGGRSISSP
jgi:tRNA threonylcarbamoyladenosine biosynthesis protein TsaE